MQQQLVPNTLLRGGTYKITKVLGQGSFGITYLAEHTLLGKKVAIKEFFMKELNQRGEDGSITGMTEGSLSYNYARKFQKEAQNLARLEHPNIVRVTDSFEENGTFYYVMDYIEGVNLNDYVKNKVITEDEAVSIIKEVAEALIYMHDEKHMLHLDLKPGNVMRRNSDGHIYLIDFGLSKHYSDNGQPETSTTIGLGTAGYAPVEQGNKAKNGEFRPTIDVYALGATLYKLLTRETPPAASELVSDDELLSDKLKEKNISPKLIDFVVKAMQPSVKKRIQTMKEFKDSIPSTSSVAKTTEIPVKIVKDEETETVDVTEETDIVSSPTLDVSDEYEEEYETADDDGNRRRLFTIIIVLVIAIVLVIGIVCLFTMKKQKTSHAVDSTYLPADSNKTMYDSIATFENTSVVEPSEVENVSKDKKEIIENEQASATNSSRDRSIPEVEQDVVMPIQNSTSADVPSDNRVYDVVEQMPSYPGGQGALMQYLSSHIKYPVVAEENGIQGRVICTFVVEKDGSVTDVRIAKSVDPSLDKEALRVTKSMPKWIPGKQHGSAVRVKFTLPVTFRLQ